MSYRVNFTELADHDLDDILDYIAQDNPVNAIRFIDQLEKRITKTLGIFPNGGNRYRSSRYFSFDNYVVVYDVDESLKIVNILLITEGHRQWKAVLDSRML